MDEMAPVPVRTLTLGLAEPHPLSTGALQKGAVALDQAATAFRQAGYEVQSTRLSTRPMLSDMEESGARDLVAYARDLQQALDGLGVQFLSLGPAMPSLAQGRAELLAEVIAGRPSLYAAVMVAVAGGACSTPAATSAARVMLRLAETTEDGLGSFNFAALACVGPGAPFFPAAYHAGPASLGVALQSAGAVAQALRGGAELQDVPGLVCAELTARAAPVVELAREQATALGVAFRGIDLSPAPDGDDSVAAAMELAGHGLLGGPGSLALAAAVTQGVRGTGLPMCGYCGLMLPVMEDTVLARRWEEGNLDIDRVLSYSAVCGTGLDTVPVPGDSSVSELAAVISDVAALAVRYSKPLSARLLPVPEGKAGERTRFSSPYLVNTLIRPLSGPGR